MTDYARTGAFLRAFARRDRWMLGWWIAGLWVLYVTQAPSVQGLYPTQAELDRAAETLGANAAFVALAGPPRALDTVGGQVVWQSAAFGAIVAGLMSMFLVVRHTRAEEESGRDELVRATAVGRLAPVTAAIVLAVVADLLAGGLVAAGLVAFGLPVAGSAVAGVALALTGVVFAAVALVAAQVCSTSRGAYGLTGAVIGIAFVLRAAGDVGDGTLSWLSPIGWGQATRPFAGERLWPLLLPVAATAALLLAARALSARRDLGAGLLAQRPGPATGRLGSLGLVWRTQRGALAGWTLGVFATGLTYGSVGDSVGDVLGDSAFAREALAAGAGSGAALVDGFYASAALLLGLLASGWAIASALRAHGEEDGGRIEALLATGLSRRRWMLDHLAIAAGGTLLVVAAGGLGLGLAYAVVSGDAGQVWRLTAATLPFAPAALVLAGVAVALHGAAPRATVLAWAALAFCAAVMLLGGPLRMPGWLRDASPFTHPAAMPLESFAAGPVLALVAVAGALGAAGVAAILRRDLR